MAIESVSSNVRSLEEQSSHPMARASVRFCSEVFTVQFVNVTEVPGKGNLAITKSDGTDVLVDSESLMSDFRITLALHQSDRLDCWSYTKEFCQAELFRTFSTASRARLSEAIQFSSSVPWNADQNRTLLVMFKWSFSPMFICAAYP